MDLVDTKLEPPHLQRNAAEFQTIGDIAAGSNDGPVLMVNMNGYYPEAGYPDGELYQTYIQGLGPFLQGAGGLLLCRMPVYGQAVGQQRVDEIVFAWYPTPQLSPHFDRANKPLNPAGCERALAKACMSGASRCSGMLGINS